MTSGQGLCAVAATAAAYRSSRLNTVGEHHKCARPFFRATAPQPATPDQAAPLLPRTASSEVMTPQTLNTLMSKIQKLSPTYLCLQNRLPPWEPQPSVKRQHGTFWAELQKVNKPCLLLGNPVCRNGEAALSVRADTHALGLVALGSGPHS